jgi:hypothetical protein
MTGLLLRLLGLFASCGHRQNSVGYANKKMSLNSVGSGGKNWKKVTVGLAL